MDFYSALSYWGDCNFTDITEFKPAVLLSRRPGGIPTYKKGQERADSRLCTARQGWKTKQRTTSLGQTFSFRHLEHFRFPAEIFLSAGARMKLTLHSLFNFCKVHMPHGIALSTNGTVFSFPVGEVVTLTYGHSNHLRLCALLPRVCSQGTDSTFTQWEPAQQAEPGTHRTNCEVLSIIFFTLTGRKEQYKNPKFSQHHTKPFKSFKNHLWMKMR